MKTINYDDVKNLNVTIIDVQDNYLYKCNPLGNVNIPYDNLIDNYKNILDKTKKYYIVCDKGHLSKRACQILEYFGYNVVMVVK